MLVHNLEGYVYQADAPYMLAYYVKKMFAVEKQAETIGAKAKEHAAKTHNRDENLKTLLSIYSSLNEQ